MRLAYPAGEHLLCTSAHHSHKFKIAVTTNPQGNIACLSAQVHPTLHLTCLKRDFNFIRHTIALIEPFHLHIQLQ